MLQIDVESHVCFWRLCILNAHCIAWKDKADLLHWHRMVWLEAPGETGQLHRISFARIREWAGCASASWVACLASSHNFLWLSLDRCCIWQVRTTFFGYHWIDVVYIYIHIYIYLYIYIYMLPPKCLPFYIVSSLLLTNLSVIMIKSILILIWF